MKKNTLVTLVTLVTLSVILVGCTYTPTSFEETTAEETTVEETTRLGEWLYSLPNVEILRDDNQGRILVFFKNENCLRYYNVGAVSYVVKSEISFPNEVSLIGDFNTIKDCVGEGEISLGNELIFRSDISDTYYMVSFISGEDILSLQKLTPQELS